MSDASEIGIRVSLTGGKAAAVEADILSKSIKGVGTAAAEADAKAAKAGGASGGLSFLQSRIGNLNKGLANIGTIGQQAGANLERGGIVGGAAIGALSEKLGEAESKSKTLFGQVSGLGKYLGIGLAVGAGVAVYEVSRLAVEFDATVARIAGNTGVPIAAANAIGQAFLHTAGYMTQSGQEMATAYAPVSGQLQSITGHALDSSQALVFMKSAADLAEASGTDLNSTTATLAATMQAYHLDVSQAADASNILFNISKQANLPLSTLNTTVSMLHARLGQVIPSLSDMGGLMESLIHQGANSSRSLRIVQQAFSTLLGGSKSVNDMLSTLGVHIFDSNGKFVGMASVIDQLSPKLAALPPQLQLLVEKTLFGAGAEELMGQVVLAGGQAFDTATAAVQTHNAVQDAAAKQVGTTAGQWKVFKSQIEDWATLIGQKVLPKLLELANWLLRNKLVLAAFAIVIGVAVVVAIGTYIASVIIATSATALFWAVATLGIAVAAVAIVAGIIWLVKNWSRAWADIKQWVHDAAEWIMHHALLIGVMLGPIGPLVVGIAYLVTHWSSVWDTIKGVIHTAWMFIKPIIDAITTAVSGVGKAFGWATGLGKSAGGFAGDVAHIFGYAEGGVVPGPIGAAQLAVVHGGETIIPPSSTVMPTIVGASASSALIPTAGPTTTLSAMGSAVTPTSANTPLIVQLVVDKRVIAETVIDYIAQRAART